METVGYSNVCDCDSLVESLLKTYTLMPHDGPTEDDILSLKSSSANVTNAIIQFSIDQTDTGRDAGTEIYGPQALTSNVLNLPTWRDCPEAILVADVVEPIVGTGDENPWVLFFIYSGPRAGEDGPITIHVFDFSCLRGIDLQKSLDRIRKALGIRELIRHQHSIRIPAQFMDHFMCPADSGLCLLYLVKAFLKQGIHRHPSRSLHDGRAGWIGDLKSSFRRFSPCSVKASILGLLELKFGNHSNGTTDLASNSADHLFHDNNDSWERCSADTFWTQPRETAAGSQLDRLFIDSSQSQISVADFCIPSSSRVVCGQGDEAANNSDLFEATKLLQQFAQRNANDENHDSPSKSDDDRRSKDLREPKIGQQPNASSMTASSYRQNGASPKRDLPILGPNSSDVSLSSHKWNPSTAVLEMPALAFYGNTPPSAQFPGSTASPLQQRIRSVLESRKRARSKSRGRSEDPDAPPKRLREMQSSAFQMQPSLRYMLNARQYSSQGATSPERMTESPVREGHREEQQQRHLELQKKVKALEATIRQQSAELSKLTEDHRGPQSSTIHVSSGCEPTDNYRPARR